MDISPERLNTITFPIGQMPEPTVLDASKLEGWIQSIVQFPAALHEAVANLSDDEKALQYRPGSWSVAQIVHHCADSHMNAYIRTKLSYTLGKADILPYDQDLWASLPDANAKDLTTSLHILSGMHARWTNLMHSFTELDWQKGYNHPEYGKFVALWQVACTYAWHSNHHLAQIKGALEMRGNFTHPIL